MWPYRYLAASRFLWFRSISNQHGHRLKCMVNQENAICWWHGSWLSFIVGIFYTASAIWYAFVIIAMFLPNIWVLLWAVFKTMLVHVSIWLILLMINKCIGQTFSQAKCRIEGLPEDMVCHQYWSIYVILLTISVEAIIVLRGLEVPFMV